VLAELVPGQEPLLVGVQRELHRLRGVLVPLDAFDVDKLPSHLRVTFAVEDEAGAEVARGKDLAQLQEKLAAPVRAAVAAAVGAEVERSDLRDWPEQLPRVIERTTAEHTVRGYPALVAEANGVAVRVFATEAEQRAAMPSGVRRLLRLRVPSPVKVVERSLTARQRLVLGINPDGDIAALLDDCANAAVDSLVGTIPWDREAFEHLVEHVRDHLVSTTIDTVQQVERVLAAAHEVRAQSPQQSPPAHQDAIADIKAQFRRLLPPGFVAAAGVRRLADLRRYLMAMARRLELLPRDVDTDGARMARAHAVEVAYDELVRALPAVRAQAEDVRAIGWQLEELRVSLWAQQLGTPRPVSEQRIFRALDAITP
jgi:ATP-dependent helicase HrpA